MVFWGATYRAWSSVKNMYKKMAKIGDELIQNLIAHTPGTNVAELEKETMLKLLRSMK